MTLTAAYWALYAKQRRAVYLVREALRKGDLTRGTCAYADASCGGRIEGHHEDYDAPLAVVWLCVKHHRELHAERRREAAKAA